VRSGNYLSALSRDLRSRSSRPDLPRS
jgi:hypothetical protein